MKRLEHMKECLIACVENQMNHLEQADTKELGEAIDMIKDLEEAIYYKTITESMNQKTWEHKSDNEEKMYYDGNGNSQRYYGSGRMYYDNGSGGSSQMYYNESGRGSAN
jgi:DUF438 domain-containing protein